MFGLHRSSRSQAQGQRGHHHPPHHHLMNSTFGCSCSRSPQQVHPHHQHNPMFGHPHHHHLMNPTFGCSCSLSPQEVQPESAVLTERLNQEQLRDEGIYHAARLNLNQEWAASTPISRSAVNVGAASSPAVHGAAHHVAHHHNIHSFFDNGAFPSPLQFDQHNGGDNGEPLVEIMDYDAVGAGVPAASFSCPAYGGSPVAVGAGAPAAGPGGSNHQHHHHAEIPFGVHNDEDVDNNSLFSEDSSFSGLQGELSFGDHDDDEDEELLFSVHDDAAVDIDNNSLFSEDSWSSLGLDLRLEDDVHSFVDDDDDGKDVDNEDDELADVEQQVNNMERDRKKREAWMVLFQICKALAARHNTQSNGSKKKLSDCIGHTKETSYSAVIKEVTGMKGNDLLDTTKQIKKFLHHYRAQYRIDGNVCKKKQEFLNNLALDVWIH